MAYQYPLNGGRINASIGGNSTSAGAGYSLLSTGTLHLMGGNNVTLSQNANSITISGAAIPSQTAYSFANGGGVSFGTNASTVTATVATTYAASNHSHGNPTLNLTNISGTTASASNGLTLSLSAANQTNQNLSLYGLGNTTQNSSTLLNASNLSFNGLGGATVGFSNGSIQVSGAQTVAQTNQTIGMYATGANTTGQSSSNTIDARSFSISAQGGLYAGMSGNTLQLSAATTYAASNHSHGNPTLNLTNLSGTTASASNGLTLSLSAASQSIQTQNMASILGSSGNISFANGNNVTFGGNASTVTASASFNQTNQTANFYVSSNSTQLSSSAGIDLRSVTFQGAGAASMGVSEGKVLVSVPVQSVQTQNIHNLSLSGNTAGVMAQISSGTLTLAGGANITLSQNGNAVTISGAAGGGAAGSNTFGMSNLGNTIGTSGVISGSALQFAFAGGNNITLSQSLNASSGTITISAANQSVQTQNMASVLGSSGDISFANGNNITFGGNASTITASASFNQTNQNVSLYALGNTTQNSSTLLNASNLSFNGLGGATVGFSNGSIQISGAAGGGGGGGVALYDGANSITSGTASILAGGALTASVNGQTLSLNAPAQSSLSATGGVSIYTTGSTISIGAPTDATISRYMYPNEFTPLNTIGAINNTVSFNYVSMDQNVSASQYRAIFSVSAASHTSASTNTYALTAEIGVYTRNASTISKMSSGSQTWSGTYSTNATSSIGGVREFTIPMNVNLSAGEYWFGFRMSSSSSNAAVGYSQYVVSNQQTVHLTPGRFGAATNTSQLLYPWHGVYSTTTSALPASATLNDVRGTGTQASAGMFWFDLRNYTVL